jgi:hypothetical protein
MTTQILNTALTVLAAFMSTKQGLIILNPKQEPLAMNNKGGLDKPALIVLGTVTFMSVILIMLPGTFYASNFLMFSVFLIVMCFQLETKDLKGFARELPFFAMNLMMLYMQYPLQEVKER